MKKITSTIAVLVLTLTIFLPQDAISQSPEKMSFQSVVRNATGDLVTESLVGIQISILQGSAGGTAEYVETHSATTNVNGLVSLEIGMGTMITGTFADIDWSNGPYFIKTEIDPSGGVAYSMSATSELLSVPYAMHSSTSGDNQWSESGSGINTSNFTVGINSGNPQHTLDVRSLSQADAAGLNVSNDDRSRYVRFFSGSDMFPDPSMSWAPDHSFLFSTFDDNTFDFQEKMRISSLGDVGIGIIDPEAKLDILGGDWNLDAGNPGDLRIGNASNNFRIGVATGGDDAGVTRMYTNSEALILGVNDAPSLIMATNGAITAPNLDLPEITDAKSLITKEFADENYVNQGVTKVIVIPSSAFIPASNTRQGIGASVVIGDSYYLAGGELVPLSDNGAHLAPLILPAGTVITEICLYMDYLAIDDFEFSLRGSTLNLIGNDILFTLSSTDFSPVDRKLTYSTPIYLSNTSQYNFSVRPATGYLWNNRHIRGIKVTYIE